MRQDTFEDTVTGGERNKRAQMLLANHCRHARVQISGGTSMVGEMLDLPIGLMQVRCEHARPPGHMAHDLLRLAVEFYEENCVGCPFREASGVLPTLAVEVEARRRAAQERAAVAARDHAERMAQWERRRHLRRLAVASEGYPVRDIAALLDDLDPKPDADWSVATVRAKESGRRLVEAARRAPELFTPALAATVADLATTRCEPRTCTTIRLLARAGRIPARVALEVGLAVLAEMPLPEAGQLLAEFTDILIAEDLTEAVLDNAVRLAAEREEPFDRAVPAEPAALFAAVAVDLIRVTNRLVVLLGDGDERVRADAAEAAKLLLRANAQHVLALGEALVASIRGEDALYAGEPHPGTSACGALAEAWRGLPRQTRVIVEAGAADLTDEGREQLFRIVASLERGERWPRPDDISPDAVAVAVAFTLARLRGDWGDKVADAAGRKLVDLSRRAPEIMARHLDDVLAALLELCSPAIESPLLDPAEAPRSQLEVHVHGLERQARSIARNARRSNVAEVFGRLANSVPDAVLDRVMALFQASSGEEDRDQVTRMALLDALGHAVNVDLLHNVVPLLYTALLHDDAGVRSAAIDLWVACSRAADGRLPAELSALVSTLLADEHVVVHRAMLRALPELDVPDEDIRQVLDLTAGWARTYAGRDPDVVDRACGSLLYLAARLDDADLALVVRATAIDLAEHLDPHDRERMLLTYSVEPLRRSRLWAQRALETLGEPILVDRFNARNEPLLNALLVEPLGLREVALRVAERVAELHLPDYVGRAEEIVELLQAAGRWDDAAQLARQMHNRTPDTTEHATRRRFTGLVGAAAELEAAVAGLTSYDGSATSSSVDRQRRYDDGVTALRGALGDTTADSAPAYLARFVTHLQARLDSLAALTAPPAADPSELATQLEAAATPIRTGAIEQSRRVGDQVRRAYAGALSVAARLRRFDAAIRGADAAASELHRAAAHRTADVLVASLDRPQLVPVSLNAFAQTARSLNEATQVDAACGLLALTPMPLPLVNLPVRSGRLAPRSRLTGDGEGEQGVPLAVTVLTIDDTPLTDVAVLRPGYVYDLGVDLRVEVWPEWADRCEVQLLSTLPSDALLLPAFTFTRESLQTDENGARLAAAGTLRCTVEQRTNRPPLDCPILVRFSGSNRAELTDVAGYTRLRMRPFDPSRDALTEHAQVDERLLRLFDPLHDDVTLDPDDVQAFCRLFAACVRAAQRIMFDRAFRRGTRITEAQFHDELERHLRADPKLGGRLTRRDAVAGGFDDLLHDDVIAELKVERNTPVTVANCARYLGQPVQYGVGRGSRLSVLVILDHSGKEAPPGVLENYIDWLLPAHHGLDDPRYPSRVGVLIINTNLPVPSAWSRRTIPIRDT